MRNASFSEYSRKPYAMHTALEHDGRKHTHMMHSRRTKCINMLCDVLFVFGVMSRRYSDREREGGTTQVWLVYAQRNSHHLHMNRRDASKFRARTCVNTLCTPTIFEATNHHANHVRLPLLLRCTIYDGVFAQRNWFCM